MLPKHYPKSKSKLYTEAEFQYLLTAEKKRFLRESTKGYSYCICYTAMKFMDTDKIMAFLNETSILFGDIMDKKLDISIDDVIRTVKDELDIEL